jgi:hypothetical protein
MVGNMPMIPFATLVVVPDYAASIRLAVEQSVFIRVRTAGKRFGQMPDNNLDNPATVFLLVSDDFPRRPHYHLSRYMFLDNICHGVFQTIILLSGGNRYC